MRLVHFKSQGFKSFAEAVSFSVHEGLTGIVGPNGCGKSNVVDAVRWVLGESYAVSLRIKSLPDVLFNGSERRAPSDWCMVELRFANDGKRDLGEWSRHSEIAVRRELSRDGQSYFYINRAPVRRRDVVDLFRGTGVSPRAYGVVEQGMIGAIAEASPDELRRFLEEAAGVSHYKERRRDAERRLAGCRENLQQISRQLADAGKRIESLKRQARSAQRHQSLEREIDELGALLISRRRQQTQQQREDKQQVLQKCDNRLKDGEQAARRLKTDLDKRRQEHHALLQSLAEAQNNLAQIQTRAGVVRRDLENAAQNRRDAESRLAADREELQKVVAGLAQFTAEIEACAREQTDGEQLLAQSKNQEQWKLNALARAQETFIQKQTDSEAGRGLLADWNRQLESGAVREKMLGEQAMAQEQKLSDGRRALQELIAAGGGDAPAAAAEESALADWEAKKNARNDECQKAVEELKRAQAAQMEVQSMLAAAVAQKEAIDAVLHDDNAWADESPPRLSQVLRVQAGKWATALDAALGVYAGAFAVDELQDFYRRVGLPPVSAMVVETAIAPSGDGNSSPPELALKKLLQVIDMPKKSRDMLSVWLSQVYVAEDEKTAMRHRVQLYPGQMLVTRRGVAVTRHSIFVHGEVRGGYNWEQKTADLNARIGELKQEAKAKKERKTLMDTRLAAAEKAARNVASEIESARQALADKNIELSQWRERQSAADRRRAELENDLQTAENETAALKQLLADIAVSRRGLNARFASESDKAAAMKNELDTLQRQIEQLRRDAQQAAMKHREMEMQTENRRRRLDDYAARCEESRERQSMLEERIRRGLKEIEKHDDDALRQQAAMHRREADSAAGGMEKIQKMQRAAAAEIDEREKEREEVSRQLQTIKDQKASLQLEERELAMTIDRLCDSLADFAVSEERLAALQTEKDPADEAACQSEIDALRQKRDRLGAINFAADSELRERQTEYEKLDGQWRDIEKGEAELNTVMRRIDGETRARLKKMFADINEEFDRLYKQLFGGGRAALEMDGDSILEAGFEIRAQPPGKRLFSIRALSGGEKSATALAFVFAMLKLTPPPFCILDEVDAALDDIRSMSFISCLQSMSDAVQCILITHNKNTIESMSRLIGVTQEESGVSKIVAVDLRRATELAAS